MYNKFVVALSAPIVAFGNALSDGHITADERNVCAGLLVVAFGVFFTPNK